MKTVERTDQDYQDLLLAIRSVERGEARAIREDAGVKQLHLAQTLGVSQVSVHRWENGSIPGMQGGLNMAVAYGRELRRMLRQRDRQLVRTAA